MQDRQVPICILHVPNGANVYSESKTHKIGELYEGNAVIILGLEENGWLPIYWLSDSPGWIQLGFDDLQRVITANGHLYPDCDDLNSQ